MEATSALRRLVHGNLLQVTEGSVAAAEVAVWPIELYAFAPLAGRVWELRDSVTAYNACYVALAEVLEMPLLTLDRRLSRAPGLRCEVIVPEGI